MNNNIFKVFDILNQMTIFEINELLKLLEDKYNINKYEYNKKEDKKDDINKNFSIKLLDIGKNKISIIKVVREINNLGLKEAKDLVESFPVLIKDGLDKNSLEIYKKKLLESGAKIEII